MAASYDALVYGAGPVGAAVALGLQQRGHRVCVREKRTEHQVVIDAGKSINLSLSTRGCAMLTEIGAYTDLKSTLIPMVSRRFADGSTESYREPLQSINRNLLTIKLIQAAEAAGVKFEYGTGYAPGDVDVATGSVRLGEGLHCKPRVIVGCDGVHGKVAKLINPGEAERSSRASEWGYYELSLPPEATTDMSKDVFNNFHIWSGRGHWSSEFIVGLPNHDGSITLTLFALMSDMEARYATADGGADKFRQYLGEAYEGGLDTLATGIDEAVAGGFIACWKRPALLGSAAARSPPLLPPRASALGTLVDSPHSGGAAVPPRAQWEPEAKATSLGQSCGACGACVCPHPRLPAHLAQRSRSAGG